MSKEPVEFLPMQSEASSKALILVRIGEIFLKRRNRDHFVNAFIRQAKRVVADVGGVVVRPRYLRIEVETPVDKLELTIERLKRVFGLQSMSPAVVTEASFEAIRDAALELAQKLPSGSSFKVETNRRDKNFPMPSPAVSREVGGYIDDHTDLVVDVVNPQTRIAVEITHDEAYVFGRVIAGPGGLPVGTGGRAALLLSGGIDSPVAGWSTMRRGLSMAAIYFHSFPYTGDKSKEKVITLARHLARWHGKMPLYVVHFTDVQKELRAKGRADLAVLLYRRMMMRAAGRIAKSIGCQALVTGENIGQVASQTLENMSVIGEASPLPIIRPLVCYDKTEIIRKAKAIGTFETSILPYDDCCSLFVPKHPATKAKLHHLEKAEASMDIEAMTAELADNVEHILIE